MQISRSIVDGPKSHN